MAAVLEAEDVLARGYGADQFKQVLPRTSGSRKRVRVTESTSQPKLRAGDSGGCEQDGFETSSCCPSSQRGWEMSQAFPLRGMERTLSYEVSALRAAAAAAVAEFTGPLGPGVQLTAPDTAHEKVHPAKRGPGSQSSNSLQDHLTELQSASISASRKPSLTDGKGSAAEQLAVLASRHQHLSPGIFTAQGCPPHGAKAIVGRRPRMEDAYTAVPFLLEVPVPADNLEQCEILPPRIAPQVKSASGSPNSSDAEGVQETAIPTPVTAETDRLGSSQGTSTSKEAGLPSGSYMETLHFFGVFDGHGGAEAALHCAQTLHQRIAEALAAATDPAASAEEADLVPKEGSAVDSTDMISLPSGLPAVLAASVDGDEAVDPDSEQLMELAFEEHSADARAEGITCTSASFESALTSAFNRTDEEFGKADNAALVGTTAVVTLVGSRQLYIANCGDSRAVLCRAGMAIPLTDDHKAAREDETARVEAAGGQILFWNGVRVMGVLAVSRAIGDHCLRPYVIAQPEVTILARRPDDELLLLASDGLWDVLSNQEACTLAKRCLCRARQRGASRQSAARIAATVLTRAAVDRGSRDNVTVLVVDMSTGIHDHDDIARTPSAMLADDAVDHAHEHDADERIARVASQAVPSRQ